jgi:hypothetical protein
MEFSSGEHRLEHVRSVHRPFGCSRTDHRVQFVDEEDHLPLAFGDLLQHRLQPFLELAAVLGTCDERPQVQLHQPLVLQPFRDVSAYDPLG